MSAYRTRAQRRRRRIGVGALLLGLLALVAVSASALGLIDRQEFRVFGAGERNRVAVVYFSGDMGLHVGMGPKVAPALARHGLPVLGVSSPVPFGTRRTQAEAVGVVADAIRAALARTGAARVVLMGQSYGADIVATTVPDLPADLRRRIAAITLVVPGRSVFFRTDPTGLTYHGTPDATPAAALRRVGWAPIVCIHGAEETDSLCPLLAGTPARLITLPGGHFLHRDDKLLIATLVQALHAVDPTLLR